MACDKDAYCWTVVQTHKPLHIANARKDPEWSDNPSIAMGMIAYYGVPINWPDGAVFGTFCVLGNKKVARSETEITLLNQFVQIIELTLELLISKEKLYVLSITDALIRVPNLRYFFDSFNKEFKRCQRHIPTFCLAMLGIDHFKNINDKYGHAMGDEVQVNFAQQSRKFIREVDTLRRIGGEQFALVTPQASLKEARSIVERFKHHFQVFKLPLCDKNHF